MALLDQAMAEGASEHRRAILLAAITRAARISLEVDRLIAAARENQRREIRTMVSGEIQGAVNAIAAALDEISHNLPARIVAGADELTQLKRVCAWQWTLWRRAWLRSDQHTSAPAVRRKSKISRNLSIRWRC